jgi:hypothetical protein
MKWTDQLYAGLGKNSPEWRTVEKILDYLSYDLKLVKLPAPAYRHTGIPLGRDRACSGLFVVEPTDGFEPPTR